MDGNLAWVMISKFAVVMFAKDMNKFAEKASSIIEGVQKKHNIDPDEVLEVTNLLMKILPLI